MNSIQEATAIMDASRENLSLHSLRRYLAVGVASAASAFAASTIEASMAQADPSPNMPTQEFHIINKDNGDVSAKELNKIEQAIKVQSEEERVAWDTPIAVFGNKGWKLTILPTTKHIADVGYHSTNTKGQPYAVVYSGVPNVPLSTVMAHEVGETLEDPKATGKFENFDPGVGIRYFIGKIAVPDFVLPSWFQKNGKGPYDELHLFNRSRQTSGIEPYQIIDGSVKARYLSLPNTTKSHPHSRNS